MMESSNKNVPVDQRKEKNANRLQLHPSEQAQHYTNTDNKLGKDNWVVIIIKLNGYGV